ncbi:hypothetical protein [Streptomyces antibioticus]|uniref:hypothetical protein n=1 Tax=Streptomyces antibioticus TaxID=1890 RepID=UPI0033E5FA57
MQYRDLWAYLPQKARTDASVCRRRYPEEFAHADLVRATLRRTQQRQETETVEGAFRLRVQTALRAGMPVTKISSITGLSRERVYQIRDGRR